MTSLRHDASQRSLQLKYHPTSIPPPPPPPLTLLPPAMTAAVIGDSGGGRGREPSTKPSAERDRWQRQRRDRWQHRWTVKPEPSGGARVGVGMSASARHIALGAGSVGAGCASTARPAGPCAEVRISHAA
eukprot:CAMPEP_0179873420 /NCGR_PEP_ID=MMETSP0982-20121206/22168_1 /TAXON_ID=483367 /ORGANISM="non described non described, Strain CCMP 2436" /LENGTH=129 /DNA_ID=CAMNT_0021764793 /DNA_START=428 /DNA_END=817 /DNA_ORIENTATION=+